MYRDNAGKPIRFVEFVYSNAAEQLGDAAARNAGEIAYLGFMSRNDPCTAASVCYEWLSTKPFQDGEQPPRTVTVQFIKELSQLIFTEMAVADRSIAWDQLMEMADHTEEPSERHAEALIKSARVPAWCRPETALLVALARRLPRGDDGLPRILRTSSLPDTTVDEMVALTEAAQSFGFSEYPKYEGMVLAQTVAMYHAHADECWTKAGFRCTRLAAKRLRAASGHTDYSGYVEELMRHAQTAA